MKKQLFRISQTKLGEVIVGVAFGKLNNLLPVEKVKQIHFHLISDDE